MISNIIITELIGSLIISLLGNGVMSSCVLKKTLNDKQNVSLTVGLGWSLAITLGIFFSLILGGKAHLNIVVTIMYFIYDSSDFGSNWFILIYMFSQILGFMIGQIIVMLLYNESFKNHENKNDLILCFAFKNTSKFKKKTIYISEFLATLFFLFTVFILVKKSENVIEFKNSYIFTFMIILAICLSLGGVTGPSLSPSRDLSLRFIYFIKYKKIQNFNFIFQDALPIFISPIMASIFVGIVLKLIY